MKIKITKSILTLLSITFLFVSCAEFEPVDPQLNLPTDEDNNPPLQNFTFKVQIDGQQFIANQAQGAFASIDDPNFPNLSTITITGLKTSTLENISIVVSGDEAGSYPLTFGGSFMVYFSGSPQNINSNFSSSALDNPVIGNINITELDLTNNKVSGTFEGTLYNFEEDQTKVLTNGEFTNVPITIQ